jgi:hypothetical protein
MRNSSAPGQSTELVNPSNQQINGRTKLAGGAGNNQSINQSINQFKSSNQSVNQLINRRTKLAGGAGNNQSINQSINQSCNKDAF